MLLPPERRPATGAGEADPAESRGVVSPMPGSKAPASAAPRPNSADYAANADDLEAIKKAVDDAASVGGGLWLSYLFVLFYLAVAAGAVTHEDLFFENRSSCRFSISSCRCSPSSSLRRSCSSSFTLIRSCIRDADGQSEAVPSGVLCSDRRREQLVPG